MGGVVEQDVFGEVDHSHREHMVAQPRKVEDLIRLDEPPFLEGEQIEAELQELDER